MKKARYWFIATALSFSLFSNTWADLNQGLVVYYPFSGNADDATGKGNHGIEVGDAILAADRFGNPDSAYAINTQNDRERGYIVTSTTLPSRGSFSISLWFFTDSSSTKYTDTQSLMVMGENPNPREYDSYSIIGTKSSKMLGGVWSLDYQEIAGKDPVLTDVWHHVVLTYDQGTETQSLYLDGKAVGQKKGTRYDYDQEDIYISLGAKADDRSGNKPFSFFSGKLDNFRYYNRAISEQVIEELYTSEGGGNVPSIPESDYDRGVQDGKQQCITNPTSCGITASGGNISSEDACMATFSFGGKVHIPCIAVPDAFGGITIYQVDMQQQPLSPALLFEVDLNSVKPR